MKLAVPVTEAADLIGCSTSMVWKLIAQGDIAKAKVGRRTVIRVAELERFLADSEQANAPPPCASGRGMAPTSTIRDMGDSGTAAVGDGSTPPGRSDGSRNSGAIGRGGSHE